MSGIWYERPTPEALNRIHRDTACSALGILITEVGDDYIRGTMPVDERTRQPYGLLHGGASLVLAETLGSAAAVAVVDPGAYMSVGTALTANHLRAVSGGLVTGTARPIHLGRTGHLWEVDIVDERDRPVCLARLSTTVVPVERLPVEA